MTLREYKNSPGRHFSDTRSRRFASKHLHRNMNNRSIKVGLSGKAIILSIEMREKPLAASAQPQIPLRSSYSKRSVRLKLSHIRPITIGAAN